MSFDDLDKRWYLTAAISGAHTLGRAHIDNSGYVGWWSDPDNSGIFNNDYYKSILQKGWMPALKIGGNERALARRCISTTDTSDLPCHAARVPPSAAALSRRARTEARPLAPRASPAVGYCSHPALRSPRAPPDPAPPHLPHSQRRICGCVPT